MAEGKPPAPQTTVHDAAVLRHENSQSYDRPENWKSTAHERERLMSLVRVRDNLEWVLASEDGCDEEPIALWAQHARQWREKLAAHSPQTLVNQAGDE